MSKRPKYIFVSGGVISGIGKGIAAASIGMILKQRGLRVEFIKCDPYLNIDAGTMNPMEHGEVFVTDDAYEIDMDAGHYERFLDQPVKRHSGITSGQIYSTVIANERSLKYNGQCVDPLPFLIGEITRRWKEVGETTQADIILVEIGGTVGEYQNDIYYEAERRMKRELKDSLLHIHLIYLFTPPSVGEMKSKPGQQSVRILNERGIFPEMVLARALVALDAKRIQKLAVACGIDEKNVFSAPDVDTIYQVPLNFNKTHITDAILDIFDMKQGPWDHKEWSTFVSNMRNAKEEVHIGIIGKYIATGDYNLEDAYASVLESVKHAAAKEHVKPVITWINSHNYDQEQLEKLDGIIVPGGFGERGIDGKIQAIQYAREHKIPYLGLCYGMELAVIEFARHIAHLHNAHTTEIDLNTTHPLIHIMPDQEKKLLQREYGGTMRLGAWECKLKKGTIAYDAYKSLNIHERHRHRYEFNNAYRDVLTKHGMVISGTTPDEQLVEIIELPKTMHPFFIGVQFHPEFLSRPLRPHPLFHAFMKASKKHKAD